jgi:DNA end-binding protein Ku
MARPIWSGSISFGLVNIPVKLYAATESHRIAFHEFEQGTGQRIHHQRVAEKSGHEVPWEKIQKGFEVAKGRYVMLSDEELETAAPEKTRTVDIEQFVALDEIDPASWDQTYYLGPDGAAANKAYSLLRQSMAEKRRVAIGRFVMRTKEYVVCIRPYEGILALQTMFFPDEVRSTKIIGDLPRKAAVGSNEVAMAGRLIDSLTGAWRPDKYQDTYTKRVMDLVRKKGQGKEIEIAPAAGKEAGQGQVVDLMQALQETLARRRPPGAARGGDRGEKSRVGKPAGRTTARKPSRTPRRKPSPKAARGRSAAG